MTLSSQEGEQFAPDMDGQLDDLNPQESATDYFAWNLPARSTPKSIRLGFSEGTVETEWTPGTPSALSLKDTTCNEFLDMPQDQQAILWHKFLAYKGNAREDPEALAASGDIWQSIYTMCSPDWDKTTFFEAARRFTGG